MTCLTMILGAIRSLSANNVKIPGLIGSLISIAESRIFKKRRKVALVSGSESSRAANEVTNSCSSLPTVSMLSTMNRPFILPVGENILSRVGPASLRAIMPMPFESAYSTPRILTNPSTRAGISISLPFDFNAFSATCS